MNTIIFENYYFYEHNNEPYLFFKKRLFLKKLTLINMSFSTFMKTIMNVVLHAGLLKNKFLKSCGGAKTF